LIQRRARERETTRRQVQIAQSAHCTGDKSRLMRPRAPTAYFETVGVKRWETSTQVWERRGRQVQNHVAQSIHRQVRYKCRIMRPRASTAYLEAVGDKWETREESLDAGLERI